MHETLAGNANDLFLMVQICNAQILPLQRSSHCYWTHSYSFCIYCSFQHTAPFSASNALPLSRSESVPLHFRLAVEPLEANVFLSKMFVWMYVNSRSLKSRRRQMLSLPWLRHSATTYICVERRQLSIRRFAFVHHAIFDRLSSGAVVGERVYRRGG